MSVEENKAIAKRLFDAINNGTLDELPEVVAPDVVDHNAVIFMQPEGSRRGRGRHPYAPARFPRPPLDHSGARR